MKRLLAAMCLMAVVTPTCAEDTWRDWSTAGWWHVGYNAPADGCAFYAVYQDSNVLRLNVFSDDSGEWVLVMPGAPLKNGVKYKISLVFNGNDSWNATVPANVTSDGGYTVTWLQAGANLQLLRTFSRARSVQIYAGVRHLASLSLTGSQAAFEQALLCKESRIANNNEQPAPQPEPSGSTGTGFLVSKGNVLTANHVVKDCGQYIKIMETSGEIANGHIARHDENSDLAIVHADNLKGTAYATFRVAPPVRAGENVAVFGYPLNGVLSSTGNIVAGYVTSLAGVGNDASKLQISAPVQPGDSGGPVLDSSGAVIGMVVSMLDASNALQKGGFIPQNINFAVKTSSIMTFLDANAVPYSTASVPTPTLQLPELAEKATSFTVAIECK